MNHKNTNIISLEDFERAIRIICFIMAGVYENDKSVLRGLCNEFTLNVVLHDANRFYRYDPPIVKGYEITVDGIVRYIPRDIIDETSWAYQFKKRNGDIV